MQTFLAAHVQSFAPDRRVVATTGLFGDCLGNLERATATEAVCEAIVVALEWPDLDPRLGLRSLGGWGQREVIDIAKTVAATAERLGDALTRAATRAPVHLSLPTMLLPPVSHLPGGRAGSFELDLRRHVDQLGARAAQSPNVAIINPQRLDRLSPHAGRRDVTQELATGFPYTLAHASALGELLARLIVPAAPKKGIITDLDDTLWRGLVGEVGPDGVTWDLDHKSQAHGLYQQMLRSLAETGALVAVASKNDPEVVARTFEARGELADLRRHIFPWEVSWGPKSHAVGRILRAWNVGAADVVFVDDSPLELAEARDAFPEMTCLRFPKESDSDVYALLEDLRDQFGKASVSADDALRAESLRQAEAFRRAEASAETASPDAFLAQLDAELTLTWAKEPIDPRTLELVNKTNQFNLNGRRYTEGDWLALLRDPQSWLLAVGYKDKFGPLGTVGVLAGSRVAEEVARLHVWVMSCRAFSRRIEHACLKAVFDRIGPAEIAFDFQATPKNGVLQTFFTESFGQRPEGPFKLPRSLFQRACPPLHHRLTETP